jgi:type IV secretion system protein VirD4
LLYAASLTGRPIEDVLRWTLRQDTTDALEILASQHQHETAANVLAGIERTDTRERSSIYSATAGVLAAYNADATRATAKDPNFDPREFAKSTDTIYITAPEHRQAQCAPLIVGLLEQIRHAVYEEAGRLVGRGARQPMLWALDEVANIAPIHDLPALVSQAGGQGLQVMVGLQDLSQARGRWGEAAAEGFMSLFQTRLVLNGIADPRTLESISLALGEYDRTLVSASAGTSESEQWLAPQGRSEGVSCQTQSRRTLTPGEIASLPRGHGLLLEGGAWELIRLTPWHRNQGWADVAHNSIYG